MYSHFVTKLFDVYTPFSVGLIFLLYKCFEEISIVKPVTSRGANSERYLVCKKPETNLVKGYLFHVNELFAKNTDDSFDIIELVPLGMIRRYRFFQFHI